MMAQVINEFGGPDVFTSEQIPRPMIKPNQILIQVEATSVNPLDYKIRQSQSGGLAPEFPAVLHGDVAGVVHDTGADVSEFEPGDEVYACAGGVGNKQGGLAEFMSADAALVAEKPISLTMAESAAMPLVTITAWDGLIDRANVREGQRVLVHGATGGVGHIGIQLAKHAGAVVHATGSSAEKLDIATKLGADVTINYQEQSVSEYVEEWTDGHGYDVVFDTVGSENIQPSIEAAAVNGHVITTESTGTHDLRPMLRRGLSLHVVFMIIPLLHNIGRAHHGEILRQTAKLVDSDALKPLLDGEPYSFERVDAAHRRVESGEHIGKVTIAR